MDGSDGDDFEAKVYGPTLTKSRCIAPLLGDDTRHRFLVGTCSLHADNELHLFEYSGDTHEFCNSSIFPHGSEIWNITTSPTDDTLFFAVHNEDLTFKATLYQIAEEDSEGEEKPKQVLEARFALDPSDGRVSGGQLQTVLWNRGSSDRNRVASVDSQRICDWDLAKETLTGVLYSGSRRIVAGRRDPNFGSKIGFAEHTSVGILDTREFRPDSNSRLTPSVLIPKAHDYGVCDLDFNPVHFHTLVTAGEDFKMRFWDIRQTHQCVKVVCAHSHWVTCVRINPLKDQLVLSSSTDGLVRLWDVSSVSSLTKPKIMPEEDGGGDPIVPAELEDRLVSEITEHQESIYSVAWSNCDSWVYVSVSYNGRVLLHHVPFETKDSILSGGDAY